MQRHKQSDNFIKHPKVSLQFFLSTIFLLCTFYNSCVESTCEHQYPLSNEVLTRRTLSFTSLKLRVSDCDQLPMEKMHVSKGSRNATIRRRISPKVIMRLRGGSQSNPAGAEPTIQQASMPLIQKENSPLKDDSEKLSTFTKLRRTAFPIYGPDEVTKFLLIGSIKFFIIMALTLTRDTKDTLVVTQCGAEAITFLKVSSYLLSFQYFQYFAMSCPNANSLL